MSPHQSSLQSSHSIPSDSPRHFPFADMVIIPLLVRLLLWNSCGVLLLWNSCMAILVSLEFFTFTTFSAFVSRSCKFPLLLLTHVFHSLCFEDFSIVVIIPLLVKFPRGRGSSWELNSYMGILVSLELFTFTTFSAFVSQSCKFLTHVSYSLSFKDFSIFPFHVYQRRFTLEISCTLFLKYCFRYKCSF